MALHLMMCGNDDHLAPLPQGVAMNQPTLKPVILPGYKSESPGPSLRSIVRKSALLNLTIVLTSFPVLVLAGGPKAIAPTLAIMVGISVLIWTCTFTLFSFVSLARIFWIPVSPVAGREPPHPAEQADVADRWLDGPV
jgi:hypothetical protein